MDDAEDASRYFRESYFRVSSRNRCWLCYYVHVYLFL